VSADRVGSAPRFGSVAELLEDARSRLSRLSPVQAEAAIRAGAGLVDIRTVAQRLAQGDIPGALIVERNHLEWRLHPTSDARVPEAVVGQRWIVVCAEGYSSSLAADTLNSLGIPATDVVGGFGAWVAAGLPTTPGATPAGRTVPTAS
jgi:rhodanese-related sulfurtransferase